MKVHFGEVKYNKHFSVWTIQDEYAEENYQPTNVFKGQVLTEKSEEKKGLPIKNAWEPNR